MYYAIKIIGSALLIVLVAETSKRSAILGGLLASLPMISYVGIILLYHDTGSIEKVSRLSWSIFWLVLPTLPFFVALPLLLKRYSFVTSMFAATTLLFGTYYLTVSLLRRYGSDLLG